MFILSLLVEQEASGGSVPSILHRITSCEEPPTYMKTNRFTKGFQAIVDAYGIASYEEVNPGMCLYSWWCSVTVC